MNELTARLETHTITKKDLDQQGKELTLLLQPFAARWIAFNFPNSDTSYSARQKRYNVYNFEFDALEDDRVYMEYTDYDGEEFSLVIPTAYLTDPEAEEARISAQRAAAMVKNMDASVKLADEKERAEYERLKAKYG